MDLVHIPWRHAVKTMHNWDFVGIPGYLDNAISLLSICNLFSLAFLLRNDVQLYEKGID